MPRTKGGVTTRRRHKKVLKAASGHRGARHKIYSIARDSARKAAVFAYTGRKNKKRDFRALWIQRINAAVRDHGLSYSKFMGGLTKAGVTLDRRVLAHIALTDPTSFGEIAKVAQQALA